MRRKIIGYALFPAAMLMAGTALAKPTKPKQSAIHDAEDAQEKRKLDEALKRIAERPNTDVRLRRKLGPEIQRMPEIRLAQRPTRLTVIAETLEDGLLMYHLDMPRLKNESEAAYKQRMLRARKTAGVPEKFMPILRRRLGKKIVLELRNDQSAVAHVTGVTDPKTR